MQEYSANPVFVHSVAFLGTQENKNGLFAFDENINFEVAIRKKKDFVIDKKAVMSVIIMTLSRTRICNYEMQIGDLKDESLKIKLSYKSKTLMPNNYLIRVVTHIPNVQFYDRQDTCTFKVSDSGTEFLKYNGADNGLIVYQPDTIVAE